MPPLRQNYHFESKGLETGETHQMLSLWGRPSYTTSQYLKGKGDTMHELDLLIVYWQTNYALNYVKRTPITNAHILHTIKYLTELQKLKGGLL